MNKYIPVYGIPYFELGKKPPSPYWCSRYSLDTYYNEDTYRFSHETELKIKQTNSTYPKLTSIYD